MLNLMITMQPSEYVGLGVLAGVNLTMLVDVLISRVRRRRREAQREAAREAAKALLRRNGMTDALYLPAAGLGEGELREALDTVVGLGTVILDRNGAVVGKVAPTLREGPYLRLVVDNSTTK